MNLIIGLTMHLTVGGLLDDVVQTPVLPDLHRRWRFGVKRFEHGQLDAVLVYRNRFGLAILVDHLPEITKHSRLVTMGSQQEINRIALLVDGAKGISIGLWP